MTSKSIASRINYYIDELSESAASLIAISKTKPIPQLVEAYKAGQRDFGENKVQELVSKFSKMPTDVRWHMVGHLQRNKVKLIVPFVHLIHSVDSPRLLDEIEKEAVKIQRTISVLFQVHIADETEKFGFSQEELLEFLTSDKILSYTNIRVKGLMGMATFTDNEKQVGAEFERLHVLFEQIKQLKIPETIQMKHLSMGMSGDYHIALKHGATLVRIGSSLFGSRK